MSDYVVYSPVTGKIVATGSCPEGMEAQQAPEGYRVTKGSAQAGLAYVDEATQEIHPCGLKPSSFHFFDFTTKQWVLNSILLENDVRTRRNTLLLASDWTQLPDVPSETKDQWAKYRQLLRDITDQAGFPESVIWPNKPE